jgi:hypothetical protein
MTAEHGLTTLLLHLFYVLLGTVDRRKCVISSSIVSPDYLSHENGIGERPPTKPKLSNCDITVLSPEALQYVVRLYMV